MSHYKNTCPACKQVSQCRCIGPKTETNIFCKECSKKGLHECACKFYRDNAGKEIMVYDEKGRGKPEILGPAKDCKICNNTGWCA